jgi:hypothetical protein
MLPPHVQAPVKAALAEREASGQEFGAQRSDPPGVAGRPSRVPAASPYLFVVRSGAAPVFSSLRELAWSRPDLLGVVFDRRWMGDRRARQHPVRPERRGTERRRGTPESTWDRRGFLLVRPAPAPSTPVRSAASQSRRAVWSEPVQMRAVASRLRSRGPAVAFGLGTAGLLGAISATGVYLGAVDTPLRTTEWALSAVLSSVPDSKVSGQPESGPPVTPAPRVEAAPSPSVESAPKVAPAPSPPVERAPSVARAEPEKPAPSRVPRRAGSVAIPRAVAPAEPEGAAGVPIGRCVAPTSPTVAVQGDKVLGTVVGVKIDADSRPPRCLFVVERHDKALWVVDSSRAEIRPR